MPTISWILRLFVKMTSIFCMLFENNNILTRRIIGNTTNPNVTTSQGLSNGGKIAIAVVFAFVGAVAIAIVVIVLIKKFPLKQLSPEEKEARKRSKDLE